MNRRTFVKGCLLTSIGALGPFKAIAAATPASAINLETLPLLFLDDSGLERFAGVRRTFHQARTHAKPVLAADRPWEKGRVYIYGSVLRDEASGEFRMWYGTPKPSFVLLATSRDGRNWKKGSLGLHDYEGSRDNNIVIEALHSPSLVRDFTVCDTTRRYRIIGSREKQGYFTAHSPDGTRWTFDAKSPVLQGDDTLTLAQHPITGEFLLYHKRQVVVRGFKRRTIWLSRSKDFQHWTEPQMVFAPDSLDDEWANETQRTDVYDMSVFPHASGFLGTPAMFRVMTVRPKSSLGKGQSRDDGPITLQLATSTDGRQWSRPSERASMIPLGQQGTFDQGGILGVSNHLVHHKDETWLYYTALSTTHGAPIPPKELTIGRADWRLHGFASLDAGSEAARVETRALGLGRGLTINANASRGILRAGLADENGKPLAGYELENSIPLRKDDTQWSARWKSGSPAPRGRPVRVVIEMRDASLFSLSSSV